MCACVHHARPVEVAPTTLEFAELWDRYDVVGSTQGRRLFHHPDVGDFALASRG
ncbi:hypothetical protein [Streptomyces sp. NPDC001816]|uniref:MmyB family transcriptional regulator n=1 Tax=Streptomyces sp. NPDC001816 TaxID=3364612 RepID=UPI0036B3E430